MYLQVKPPGGISTRNWSESKTPRARGGVAGQRAASQSSWQRKKLAAEAARQEIGLCALCMEWDGASRPALAQPGHGPTRRVPQQRREKYTYIHAFCHFYNGTLLILWYFFCEHANSHSVSVGTKYYITARKMQGRVKERDTVQSVGQRGKFRRDASLRHQFYEASDVEERHRGGGGAPGQVLKDVSAARWRLGMQGRAGPAGQA